MAIVYMHTNKTTGKSYIGVTTRTMEERWKEHCRKIKRLATHFSNAINKYGTDNWEHNILYEGDESECYIKEKHLISEYDTLKNGYNSIEGGFITKGLHSPEITKKYSGKNNYQFKGYYITPYGKYETLNEASINTGIGWQKIKKRCVIDNNRKLTINAIRQAKDLDNTMIGKTFKDIGWGFEHASNTST